METTKVRRAFTGLVEDVQVMTTQRNELARALHNVLAVVDHDDLYLTSAAVAGESATTCGHRLLLEARALLARTR